MEYRRMAEEIREDEIRVLLSIIYPTARMISFKHHRETNFISVTYSFLNEGEKEHKLDLLPDDVYVIEDGDVLDGQPLDGNIMYEYSRFTIARGYSEIWLNNPYIKA